ncbi:MAG TPA: hypothetical protein ENK09_01345 [Nitrospirae bacterium]|nr:hypothetical protein [Nitrospirota bacterium]
MKRLVLTLTVVALIAIGTVAYAIGPGWWWGGGAMMASAGYGPGYMMDYCPVGYGTGYGYDQKFLQDTRDLRKQLTERRFEYFEALRDPATTPETIAKLEKEITDLQQKIYEKAPKTAFRGGYGWTGRPGWCW